MNAAGALALAAALQGAVLAVVLWRRGRRLPANRWLALLMALVALRLLNQYAWSSPPFGTPPVTPRLSLPLLFTFTPLLFLYLRDLARPRQRRGFLLHLVPAAAALLYTLPFYWVALRTPVSAWTEYGRSLRWESAVFNALIVAQMAAYLAPVFRLVPGYERRASEVASNLDVARFRWTRWLAWALAMDVMILAAVTLLQVLGVADLLVARRDVLLAAFMAVILYGTGFMALSQSALFSEEPEAAQQAPKYARSSLTSERAEEGLRLLRALMERDRLYAEPDLTLATLADRMRLPPSQVSQVINERLAQSFYDMVNGYRVEAAKRLLVDRRTRQQTILAVGLQVGFRSKAAYNRVFKQKTGLTPSEFRAHAGEPATIAD
jgi:AraC-like DNA-binding protein